MYVDISKGMHTDIRTDKQTAMAHGWLLLNSF